MPNPLIKGTCVKCLQLFSYTQLILLKGKLYCPKCADTILKMLLSRAFK
jgi:PHP family Zn ribbon phosphoesterase